MPHVAEERVDVERDVVYGVVAGEPLLLDVYRSLPRGEPRPAVVLIHGGGMWTGSRAHMEHPAQQLARAGYVAFSVDYRLVDAAAGRHRWPAQLDDVQRAVRWVRAHAADYGVDPMRVGAYGWSAGGQLAALLGTRDTRDATAPLASYPSRVACVVDLAGDVDLAAYTAATRPARGRRPAGRDAAGGARSLPRRLAAILDRRTHGSISGDPRRPGRRGADRAVAAPGGRPARGRSRGGYVELAGAGHDDLTWARVGPAVLAFLDRHLRPGV